MRKTFLFRYRVSISESATERTRQAALEVREQLKGLFTSKTPTLEEVETKAQLGWLDICAEKKTNPKGVTITVYEDRPYFGKQR